VPEALLSTEALTRRFGALAAVNEVSLAFEEGRVHAVIGPNGAGKSTFLNLLSGELRATQGHVRFRGMDVTPATPDELSRLGIGRTYQTANLFPELACTDCVWLAAQSRLRSSMRFFRPARWYAEVGVRAARALDVCGLSQRGPAVAGRLSYGEQRQLEIAMMLATEPTLLLLDEPLAGLGHDEALRVVDLLKQVARGRTVILVEHDMDAVFRISDTVTVLVDGRVLERGSPDRVRNSAAVREAYLGEEVA
jgi:branched-chain amino acid transport system ATP-binding protein